MSEVRCDRHVDAYYPVKCAACDSLTREYEAMSVPVYPVYKDRSKEEEVDE